MKKQLFIMTAVIAGLVMSPIGGYSAAKQQAQTTQTEKQVPLSQDEQNFAMQLSTLHRQIFTTLFTPVMRQEAMGMMTSGDDMEDETPMTADMAVEQTIMNHRDVVQTSTTPSTNQPEASSSTTLKK